MMVFILPVFDGLRTAPNNGRTTLLQDAHSSCEAPQPSMEFCGSEGNNKAYTTISRFCDDRPPALGYRASIFTYSNG
jgi:hypothetical protein